MVGYVSRVSARHSVKNLYVKFTRFSFIYTIWIGKWTDKFWTSLSTSSIKFSAAYGQMPRENETEIFRYVYHKLSEVRAYHELISPFCIDIQHEITDTGGQKQILSIQHRKQSTKTSRAKKSDDYNFRWVINAFKIPSAFDQLLTIFPKNL